MKYNTVIIKGMRIILNQIVGYSASIGKVSGLMLFTQGALDADGESPYIFIIMTDEEATKCICILDKKMQAESIL